MSFQPELDGLGLPPRPFDPDRLRRLRERAKYTKDALAAKLGVRPGTVARWESGDTPSPRLMSALCMLFGVHPDYFMPDGSSVRGPMPFFREPSKVDSLSQRSAGAYCEMVAEVLRLIEVHESFPSTSLSQIDIDAETDAGRIRDAALATRADLGVTNGPMPHLVRAAEAKGVLVAFGPEGENDSSSPCSNWVVDRGVVILERRADNYYRQRFDVAHELGHLVMHRNAPLRDQNTESQANAFAAEMLMPRGEIAGSLPTVTTRGGWTLLSELQERWGVSRSALLHRARDLGVMSDVTYRNARVRLRQNGWALREPGRISDVEAVSTLPERLGKLSRTQTQSIRVLAGMSESDFNVHLYERPVRPETMDH